SADAMKFVLLENSIESVNITTPLSGYIQGGNSIITNANATITQNGWGVKFILDEGSLGEMSFFDMTEPYDAVFENLPTGEHTIDVYIVDESGAIQTGNMMHDHVHHIGTGGEIIVAFGDSITYAYNDDVSIDDVSDDGRNRGGGFEPILNNLLTLETNQPHSILNEGISGNTSADGLARLPQVIDAHPEATTYLIMFGTNDANPCCSLPIETFRTNMQQIIDTLKNAGKIPILAKAPRVMSDYFTDPTYVEQGIDPEDGTRNIIIRSYNDVIDELVAINNITVMPPDFYTYFRDTFGNTYSVSVQDGYVDNFHPDNLGYNAMAELWRDALIVQ
ncbi:SGNH/GDSL hydrolase family protein, partial [Sulfurovum sp. XTW-4]